MQTDFIEVTLAVIDAFDQLQIPYLIGGSLASALHGLSRTTLDSDLVAAVRIEHVPHLINMLGNQFYISDEAIYDAIRHHSSFNLIHLETMFKVDIFLPKGRPFDHAQMRNRQLQVVVTAPERTAYVASPEDTILAKLEWYRLGGEISERQWRDIQGVIRVQGEQLNVVYLRQSATELAIRDLLEKALAEQSANQSLQ